MPRISSSARTSLLRGVLAALALSLSLVLTGCVVGPARGGYSVGFVTAAPPAPLFESVGPPPHPGWIWVGGFWGWNGSRYVWNRGYWQAPRPGYRWVPNRWVRGPRGWRAEPGHWERGRRR